MFSPSLINKNEKAPVLFVKHLDCIVFLSFVQIFSNYPHSKISTLEINKMKSWISELIEVLVQDNILPSNFSKEAMKYLRKEHTFSDKLSFTTHSLEYLKLNQL